jgi:hypothetical protein
MKIQIKFSLDHVTALNFDNFTGKRNIMVDEAGIPTGFERFYISKDNTSYFDVETSQILYIIVTK